MNRLPFFRPPSAIDLATRELDEAKRQLLSARNQADYAMAMVTYHERRIARLQNIVQGK